MIEEMKLRREAIAERDVGVDLPCGHPSQDIFDVVCNDLLRLELHSRQAIARLELMAGTKAEPALSNPQRVYVRNAIGTLVDVMTAGEVYAARVESLTKGLAAIFGHLGERERLS